MSKLEFGGTVAERVSAKIRANKGSSPVELGRVIYNSRTGEIEFHFSGSGPAAQVGTLTVDPSASDDGWGDNDDWGDDGWGDNDDDNGWPRSRRDPDREDFHADG